MPLHPFDKHVGQRIRIARQKSKMTQAHLAELLTISFQQVQKYENGLNRTSCSRLYQISKILGFPVAFFLDEYHEDDDLDQIDHAEKPQDLLVSADAISLLVAYNQISSFQIQKSLVALAEELKA